MHGADLDGDTPVTVSLHAEQPPNEPPVAAFDGEIAGEDEDATTSGSTAEHELDGRGPWTVTLFVVDDDGAADWTSELLLSVDVLPGRAEHPHDTSAMLPVVLHSTSAFDATRIDVDSLRMGPGEARAVRGRALDHTGNGHDDLFVHFRRRDALLDEAGGQACVRGMLPEPEDSERGIPHQRAFTACDGLR